MSGDASARSPGIDWAIVDPYRLVIGRGATDELNRRFDSYYETVATQDDYQALDTAWDPKNQTYAPHYLDVSTWQIKLAVPSEGTCAWTVGSASSTDGPCAGFAAAVETGTRVGVRMPDGKALSVTVEPRDVLIASLGDSYASGEGVPDVRASRSHDAIWMDRRCHRSLFSGPALAALLYTRMNPHVSVTHLSFACSGARFRDGIIGNGYQGIVRVPGLRPLKAQIDELFDALDLAHRSPDFLTISGGGNDFGFGDIVTAAALDEHAKLKRLLSQVPGRGHDLIDASSVLGGTLAKRLPLSPERVLLTEYPNPTNVFVVPEGAQQTEAKMTSVCGERSAHVMRFIPSPISGIFTITHAEIEEMNRLVQAPLSQVTDAMAAKLGATRVVGIDQDFEGHGFCAPGLFGAAKRVRWINTVSDSEHVIGSRTGSMHPNIRGQASFARHIVDYVRKAECASHAVDDAVRARMCGDDGRNAAHPAAVHAPDADETSGVRE